MHPLFFPANGTKQPVNVNALQSSAMRQESKHYNFVFYLKTNEENFHSKDKAL